MSPGTLAIGPGTGQPHSATRNGRGGARIERTKILRPREQEAEATRKAAFTRGWTESVLVRSLSERDAQSRCHLIRRSRGRRASRGSSPRSISACVEAHYQRASRAALVFAHILTQHIHARAAWMLMKLVVEHQAQVHLASCPVRGPSQNSGMLVQRV